MDDNAKVLKEMLHEVAMDFAKDAQQSLSSMTAVVQDESGALRKVPYDTEIVEDENGVSVVPLFDNAIDEYSNSQIIEKHGFEGNMTLTKLANQMSK